MPKGKPTPAQAQLLLQLYDLRREAKLRQAREWFFANYSPHSLEEANNVAPMGSEQNAYARMVISYWDQACALLNYGLLHEQLFFETSGEFFQVWESLRHITPAIRKEFRAPHFMAHLEKAAQRYEKWVNKRAPGALEMMRQRRAQMRAAAAAASRT